MSSKTDEAALLRAFLISAAVGLSFHPLLLFMFYEILPSPPAFVGTSDAIAYVLTRGIAPIFILQWIVNELQAISNAITRRKPWSVEHHFSPGDQVPTLDALVSRLQSNTTDQGFMTAGTVLVLSATSLPYEWDARFPIAWGLVYSFIARPLYFLGYCNSTLPIWRVMGLMMGGFWFNFSALIYSFITTVSGSVAIAPSTGLAVSLYVAAPIVGAVLVALFFKPFQTQMEKKRTSNAIVKTAAETGL